MFTKRRGLTIFWCEGKRNPHEYSVITFSFHTYNVLLVAVVVASEKMMQFKCEAQHNMLNTCLQESIFSVSLSD